MYKPGITSSSSPSVSLQTASLPISASLSYSPPVPSSSRGSSCPSSLTSAPEPPQSLPLHSHIVGHYRLVTPYRLLLLPGNLLLIEDFPSPLHHLFSFRFAITEYEDRRLLRSHVSLLLAVYPFSVCRSLDRAHLLPLQRLDQFIQRPKIVRSFFSISLLRTMSSSSAMFFSSIALSCCLPRLTISSLPRSIFTSNSEIFFSHCHSVLVKTLADSEPSPILQQSFDSLRPSASVPIASKSNSIEDIKTSIAVRIIDVRTMPLYSTQSPLYSTQSMVATSSDTSATTHTENAKLES